MGHAEPLPGQALASWIGSSATPAFHTTVAVATRAPGGTFGSATALGDASLAADSPDVASDDAGDGLVAFRQEATAGGSHATHVRGFDATPPLITAFAVPMSATVGSAARFAVAASDVWGPVSLAWDFGDRRKGTGAALKHVYTGRGPTRRRSPRPTLSATRSPRAGGSRPTRPGP